MVAFFLLPSAFADQRQLYQPGFMAPYASTYSVSASPQMSVPVAPEMMYASPQYVPAQYAYPEAYPVYEQATSDTSEWANVAMLAVAGAVVGGVIGYKTQQRAGTARAGSPEMKAALLYSTTTGNTETAAGTNNEFYDVDFGLSFG